MKKSYRLIGIMWDRIPISRRQNLFCECHEKIRNYSEEYDLFDGNDYIRRIDILDLLTVKDETEFLKILDKVKYCSMVILTLNYVPKTLDKIVLEFYCKRLLQIYNCCVNKLEKSKVMILAC